jgi:hypothetical protein
MCGPANNKHSKPKRARFARKFLEAHEESFGMESAAKIDEIGTAKKQGRKECWTKK